MTAIGKDVFLFRVGMQINKHLNPILVLHHILLYGIDLLASINTGHSPAAVEIIPCNVTSGVA